MKKKLLLVLACLLVACCVLVGCNKKDDDGAETTAPSTNDPVSTAAPVVTDDPSESTDTEPEDVVPEHTHVYGEWVTTKTAGCDTKGEQTKTCACGDRVVKEFASLGGHIYNAEGKCETCGAEYADTGFTFTLAKSKDSYILTSYKGTATDVTIPKKYNGLPVLTIDKNAFKNNTKIVSITIPEGVTEIGNSAFEKCTGLVSVSIPNTVTKFGTKVFAGSANITSATLPTSAISQIVNSKDNKGIYEKLQTVVLTDGETVPAEAFSGCVALTAVTIPDSVTSIGTSAFLGCEKLTTLTIPATVTSIGTGAFDGCSRILESAGKVQYVGNWAVKCVPFYATYQVTLRDGTVGIANEAFASCLKLTSVTIADTVKYIGQNAFMSCSTLKTVTVGAAAEAIDVTAFNACPKLETITVSEANANYQSIDGNLYSKDGSALLKYAIGKAAITFEIPANVKTVGAYAFYTAHNLVAVTVPATVETIENNAFNGCEKLVEVCNLSAIELKAGDKTNGGIAQYALNIRTAETDASKIWTDENGFLFYKDIQEDSFTCHLLAYLGTETNLVLPEKCNGKTYTIYQYAFYYSEDLQTVIIPATVTGIGVSSFAGCTEINNVKFLGTVEAWTAAIGKANWSGSSLLTTVVKCSDGEVAIK